MSYKPDETAIVSFLYGELDPTEMDKVNEYFINHPDELKKYQSLQDTRSILSRLDDKEVIAPPIFLDDHTHIKPFWNAGYFKTIISIAASLLLLMVAMVLLMVVLVVSLVLVVTLVPLLEVLYI
jgi:hypothetical protein